MGFELRNKTVLFSTLGVLAGMLYFVLISFSISAPYTQADSRQDTTILNFTLQARLSMSAALNIVSGQQTPDALLLNGQPLQPSYPYPKTRTSHRDAQLGDVYSLKLQRGNNLLSLRFAGQPAPRVQLGQQYSTRDFLIGFLTLLPMLWLLCVLATLGFDRLLSHFRRPQNNLIPHLNRHALPLLILLSGISLRLWYALDMGYIQFQHDYHGHIEYIKFIAHEFFIPLPHKAWEFPQQPLYYLVNGLLYAVLEQLQFTEALILRVISFTTALLSCVGLVYSYRLLKLLTDRILIRALTLAFLCFIPSLIYLSSRINNDPWAFGLASIALFYLISSYHARWQKHFIAALLFTSLAFMTKVSTLTLEVLFFSLLLVSYAQAPAQTRSALIKFCLVGALLLAYTLFRAYYPAAGTLHLVNSGIWPGQDLRPLTLSYFFSFNITELLNQAQSSILASDNHAITRSLPTYQYGTLFFGEFDYRYWRDRSDGLLLNMQLILALGLIVPLAWIAYGFRQKSLLDWLLIGITLIAVALVLRFVTHYPSVSNTDFRYYAPVFFCFAYFFACGVDTLTARRAGLRRLIEVWLGLLFVSCIVFMVTLIRL